MTLDNPPEKLRIAVVISTVYQLHYFMVPMLQRLGKSYDVTLFIGNDAPGLLAAMDMPVRIVEIPIKRKISLWADIKTLTLLTRRLWAERFDVVYTITPKAGLLGTLAGFLSRRPVRIHTFQGEVWVTKTGLARRLFRFLDWLVARLITHTLVVSFSERDFLRQQGIFRPDQGQILGAGSISGVDLTVFKADRPIRNQQRAALGYTKDDVVFLFIGRLDPDKGISVLTLAFEELATKNHRAKLLIVGPDEGGMAAKLTDQNDLGIQILPFTNRPQDMLLTADVLVLPSFREGFGMVALEAAAVGIPAIGSNIYGITDAIVNGETGLLFEVRNSADLAEKMRGLADNPKERVRLGKNGLARVQEKFSRDNILDHFMQFFAELAQKNRK